MGDGIIGRISSWEIWSNGKWMLAIEGLCRRGNGHAVEGLSRWEMMWMYACEELCRWEMMYM